MGRGLGPFPFPIDGRPEPIAYSESVSIERNNRGRTDRGWRGCEKGPSDLGLIEDALAAPLSFMLRSKEAAYNKHALPEKNLSKNMQLESQNLSGQLNHSNSPSHSSNIENSSDDIQAVFS